ncbi:MAG: DJ/PfpI family protein [Myxococcaceae bacterium]|nr:DJ/PfpI family protein [Myxococcaceae bacterium]
MRVALLVYDRFTATDIIGPYEVLNGLPGVEIQFVAKQAGPVAVDSGAFALVAPYGLADVTQADVLVVPGSSCGTLQAAADRELTAWIQHIHAGSQWTTSVCSGALILGEAGILRGLPATTHWAAMPLLARLGARALPRERVVREGKVITAAGVSAGIDMALFLAGLIAGDERAEAIQLMLEYDPQPPYQAGHISKARDQVRQLAGREMRAQSRTTPESWALMRLAGRSFVSNARNRKLSFRIEPRTA